MEWFNTAPWWWWVAVVMLVLAALAVAGFAILMWLGDSDDSIARRMDSEQ